MYRAYFNTTKTIDGAVYLNLNPSVKFFQQENVMSYISQFKNEKEVKEELTGRSVMTLYNNRVYKIDEVDFSKSPRSKFFCDMHNKNKEMTFGDYIFENYKIRVTSQDQPMLKHHNIRTNQDIYLISEFWVLTGITEQQKGYNFKAIKNDMFANAETKSSQSKMFFETLKSKASNYKEMTQKWKIDIDEEPTKVKAYQCNFGTITGNAKKTYRLSEMQRDFSREFNGPFKGTKINSWAILYGKFSSREHETFMSSLKQTVTTDFEYKCNKPLEVMVKGDDRRLDTWTNTIRYLLISNLALDLTSYLFILSF